MASPEIDARDLPPETVHAIKTVLAVEEEARPDWDQIAATCDDEIARINEVGLGGVINGLPYHYLEDYDIRRKDSGYGDRQRRKIRDFLRSAD